MNRKRLFAVLFALLVALLVSSPRLAAQTNTTGDIAGVVSDPSGGTVPDANVSLKDETKGSTQEAKSNKDGSYRFHLLAPGPYTVSVTATSFSTETRKVEVAVGQVASLNFQLALGSSTSTVTVTESAPLLQTDNGDTSSALTQQQIANVPNPGNDLSAIVQLAPGVVVNTQGGYGNVEAFGMPATSNLFTMDGMDDNDPFLNLNNSGATNLLLGSNEIQEADVVTNGFSSAYGTFAGINVNYITKSGGNSFHGNGVYYWNGRAFNANDWLNNQAGNPRPFDNANQWAASIGGPIKKDKFFFFVNTEGLRVIIPVPQNVVVPTTAFEGSTVENLYAQGDGASVPFFCQSLTLTAANGSSVTCPAAVPGSGAGIFNLYNSAKGYSGLAPLPASQGYGCDNVQGVAGLGASTSTACAGTILENPENFAPEWQVAGRADWNIGVNDRAYMRVQYDVGTQPTATSPLNPLFNSQSHQPEYQGQLNETHVFGPTLTNQFLLAATWYSAIFKAANQAATDGAFPGALQVNDGAISSLGGINYAFPQGRNVTQYQIGDDVSKTLGNHTLKFGAKFHKNYVSDHDLGLLTRPLSIPLTLGDLYSGGDPLGATNVGSVFLQDFPVNQDVAVKLFEVAGYVQDDWKVKSNLTITPALRIEHASNPNCPSGCFSQFSAPWSTIVGDPTAPYNQQIDSGRTSALLGYQAVQWEPRISFAWSPFGASSNHFASDLVLRGGVGIFYDIFPGQISDNLAENSPLDNSFELFSTSIGGTCAGYLSPQQNPGNNLYDCASGANAAVNSTFSSGGNTLPAGIAPPSLTFTQNPKTTAPEFYKWNFQIQKGFGANDSLVLGYTGNHGIHIPLFDNSLNAYGLFPSLPATAPAPQFGEVTEVQSVGVSNYNGLTVSFLHRFSGKAGSGVVQFNYTYSHAFDDVSNGGFDEFGSGTCNTCTGSILNPENPTNPKWNYGPADYDVRHYINANYVWELPIRKAFGGRGFAPLVDGWQIAGTVFHRTGLPFSVEDPSDSGINNYNGLILPSPSSTPTSNSCSGEAYAGINGDNGSACPLAAAFSGIVAAPGSETDIGPKGLRNIFRGPDYFDMDFTISKKTKLPGWEAGSLLIGFQFFNVLNHPNFNLPVNSVADPLFGTIQSMVNPPTSILGSFLGGDASPRLIQLKAAITF